MPRRLFVIRNSTRSICWPGSGWSQEWCEQHEANFNKGNRRRALNGSRLPQERSLPGKLSSRAARLPEWQKHDEHGAAVSFPLAAARPDGTVMPLDNLLADPKAEAGSTYSLFRCFALRDVMRDHKGEKFVAGENHGTDFAHDSCTVLADQFLLQFDLADSQAFFSLVRHLHRYRRPEAG